MKLIASLLVHNEMGRYLEPCVNHLLEFCDEVRALDDGSTDGSCEWLCDRAGVELLGGGPPAFFAHEGATRQELLDWTLRGEPTHVLTVDADEFVADGTQIRSLCRHFPDQQVWTLTMREVWECNTAGLRTREDGGWRSHEIPALWRVPERLDMRWTIADRALACGREPLEVRRQYAHRNAAPTNVPVLHFGWTDATDRQRRAARYEAADGGRFHSNAHLQSILWTDARVTLEEAPWPRGLPRTDLLRRTGSVTA